MIRDLLDEHARLSARGKRVGRAVVVSVWGSAPRPAGAVLLASEDGRVAGSISGGCVDGAAVGEIREAFRRGTSRLVRYAPSDETAWSFGLACGGTIEVLVEPAVRPQILAAARAPYHTVIATIVRGPHVGGTWIEASGRSTRGPLAPPGLSRKDAAAARAAMTRLTPLLGVLMSSALVGRTSHVVSLGPILKDFAGEPTHGHLVPSPPIAGTEATDVLLEVLPRRARLVIFGATPVAQALVRLAKPLGIHTIVADGRTALATSERFPEADEVLCAWPKEAFRRVRLDADTAVCVLSHDPKFDEPALSIALRSAAKYVGAIGSKKTQAARRKRLADLGVTDEQMARLRGPIGLDLGGREPGETALAILAEVTAVRFGATARPLSEPGRVSRHDRRPARAGAS